MASAEPKSRWFPFANHCSVDEDYGRASRSPSFIPSSSKVESEESPGDEVPSNDLPANTKWWFNQQHKVNPGSFWNPRLEIFPTSLQNYKNVRIRELEAVIGDALQKKMEDDHLVEFDHYKHIVSNEPNKLLSELESQWIGIKKNEPWWRIADLDDLASFVSQKSLEHFDDCDLPLPQTNKTKLLVCDCEKGLASLGQDPDKEKSTFTNCMPRSPTSTWTVETRYALGVIGCSPPFGTAQSDETESLETPNSQLSKAQLLEALCHSQRRAREAERTAQQACNEKEHLISLFASSLGTASITQFTPVFQILRHGSPPKSSYQKGSIKLPRGSLGQSLLGTFFGVWFLLVLGCYLVGPWVGYFLLFDMQWGLQA